MTLLKHSLEKEDKRIFNELEHANRNYEEYLKITSSNIFPLKEDSPAESEHTWNYPLTLVFLRK